MKSNFPQAILPEESQLSENQVDEYTNFIERVNLLVRRKGPNTRWYDIPSNEWKNISTEVMAAFKAKYKLAGWNVYMDDAGVYWLWLGEATDRPKEMVIFGS